MKSICAISSASSRSAAFSALQCCWATALCAPTKMALSLCGIRPLPRFSVMRRRRCSDVHLAPFACLARIRQDHLLRSRSFRTTSSSRRAASSSKFTAGARRRTVSTRSMFFRVAHQRGLHYGAVFRDISVRRREAAHVRYLAEHDQLTGLANRHVLATRLRNQAASLRSARKSR